MKLIFFFIRITLNPLCVSFTTTTSRSDKILIFFSLSHTQKCVFLAGICWSNFTCISLSHRLTTFPALFFHRWGQWSGFVKVKVIFSAFFYEPCVVICLKMIFLCVRSIPTHIVSMINFISVFTFFLLCDYLTFLTLRVAVSESCNIFWCIKWLCCVKSCSRSHQHNFSFFSHHHRRQQQWRV